MINISKCQEKANLFEFYFFFTTKSADVSAYDYGYMSTNGKDGLAATETTNKENPYYFKLEQPGQIEEAAGKESPYYFKLEQPEKPN